MSDFQEGQKNMAQLILQMLKTRPASEERGVAENKIQLMIDNMSALADDRPVLGFVRLIDNAPDFGRTDCFGTSADQVLADFAIENKKPGRPRYTAIPVYR